MCAPASRRAPEPRFRLGAPKCALLPHSQGLSNRKNFRTVAVWCFARRDFAMILLPLAALLLGFFAVRFLPVGSFEANEAMARYTAIAVLAGLDTVLGGLRARMVDQFDDAIFVSGFFANTLLAGGLVVLGERLGLEAGLGQERVSAMMIAAAVVFGTRIFNNLAVLRRLLIERWRARGTHLIVPEERAREAETSPT